VDGRQLNFHLAGINNQNFIMRDEETGTWWQQVTGEAILGPLKGHHLAPVFHDEVSFGMWKREQPQGRVLQPDKDVLARGRYAPANWEEGVAKLPVTAQSFASSKMEPRTLIVGVSLNNKAKAYPLAALQKQRLVLDTIGGVSILLAIDADEKSVRAFASSVDNRKLEFFVQPDAASTSLQFVDAETGSLWDFTGTAKTGPLAGKQLQKIPVLKDYWFDWANYHPDTSVYTLGEH
jgi:hypothetical protein